VVGIGGGNMASNTLIFEGARADISRLIHAPLLINGASSTMNYLDNKQMAAQFVVSLSNGATNCKLLALAVG